MGDEVGRNFLGDAEVMDLGGDGVEIASATGLLHVSLIATHARDDFVAVVFGDGGGVEDREGTFGDEVVGTFGGFGSD